MILEKEEDCLAQLEHIDVLERLRISYHFLDEIKTILEAIYDKTSSNDARKEDDLYGIMLKFRLLRRYRYSVSSGTQKLI